VNIRNLLVLTFISIIIPTKMVIVIFKLKLYVNNISIIQQYSCIKLSIIYIKSYTLDY